MLKITRFSLLLAAASYSVFFKECWELKSETELSYTSAVRGLATGTSFSGRPLPNPAVHEMMRKRPPAELPKHLAPSTMAKSSTSNRFVKYISY